jgi:pimeloyl-ACP methyl ester carboxylesterase
VRAGVTVYAADYGEYVNSIQEMGSAVWAAVKAAGIRRPVILLGYSMGGFVAQTMYMQYPEAVSGIVFVSTSAPNTKDAIATVLSNFYNKKRVKQLMESQKREGPSRSMYTSREIFHKEFTASSAYIFSNKADAFMKSVTVPVLVIYGESDNVIPGRLLAKLRKLKDKVSVYQELILPGVGHAVMRAVPDLFSKTVLTWIRTGLKQ